MIRNRRLLHCVTFYRFHVCHFSLPVNNRNSSYTDKFITINFLPIQESKGSLWMAVASEVFACLLFLFSFFKKLFYYYLLLINGARGPYWVNIA